MYLTANSKISIQITVSSIHNTDITVYSTKTETQLKNCKYISAESLFNIGNLHVKQLVTYLHDAVLNRKHILHKRTVERHCSYNDRRVFVLI